MGYGSYYGTVEGWFIDLEDEYALARYRMESASNLDGKYYKNTYMFLIEYFDFLEGLGYKMEGKGGCDGNSRSFRKMQNLFSGI